MTPVARDGGEHAPKPLALTMGEPSGIGGELALMAWRAATAGGAGAAGDGFPPGAFILIDDPARLKALDRRLGWNTPIATISDLSQGVSAFATALPVLPVGVPAPARPGYPDPANADAVVKSIEMAVSLVVDGRAAAVVTNPIQKKILLDAGFAYPGHTEFLAVLGGDGEAPVMMLACPGLRVVPVTVHLPLAQAVTALSSDAIVHAGRVTAAALRRDFAIARPRLMVAGLNPHAGEGGAIGREEIEIIAPAVARLRAAGIEASGPAPADTMFHPVARGRYDAALCMYHDQALIPLKTVDFAGGVNITLGLPFVRTSPDHGTALDIAGRGVADPASLIAALATARRMADARKAGGIVA